MPVGVGRTQEIRSAKSRLGLLCAAQAQPERIAAARQELREIVARQDLDDAIARIVDRSVPFTADQRSKLAALLAEDLA